MRHFQILRSWNNNARQRAARRRNFLSRTLRYESLETRALLAAQITAVNVDSLFGDTDGDGVADPGDQIHYTVIVQNTGDAPATNLTFQEILNDPNLSLVADSINVSPLAINDTFTAVANTQLRVGNPAALAGPAAVVSGSVLANDLEFLGDSFSISAFQATSSQGGSISMVTSGADAGSFRYLPQAGDTGADSFTYTLRDDGIDGIAGNADDLTSVGTVNITLGGQKIWYVDNSAGATGNGTSSNPFDSLADVSGATGPDGTGDIIYLSTGSGDYTGGITLVDDQTLWGQSQALVVAGFTLQAAGTHPTIVNASGNGVTLEQGNTLQGLTVGDTSGFDIANTASASVGTLTVSNVVLAGTGGLFRADSGGALTVTLDSSSTTSASGHGIHLAGAITGSFTSSAGAISGVAGTDVLINGGSATISIANSITSNAGGSVEIASHATNNVTFSGSLNITGGTGIAVHNNASGTIAFTNASKVISTGASNAVDLDTNGTASINFTGGGLDIDTTSGKGFEATGGGTVTVQGGSNTITSTTGTALNVVNTTIGASGLTFQSISADGAASGMILNNTGTSGGLTVTGDGTGAENGSGGLITNTTGVGISLTTTRDVSLTQLRISNTGNHGVNASSVTNFTYQDASIVNAGDGNDEQTMNLLNLFGTSLIEDVRLDDIQEDGIQIRQDADPDSNLSTFDTLTIRRLDVEDHQAGFGEAGIEIQTNLASTLAVVIDDSDFAINTNAIMGVAMSKSATFTGHQKITVQNSTFDGSAAFGSGGIQALGSTGSGTTTYLVTGNTITNTQFDGIRINNDGGHTNATITNNDIDGSTAVGKVNNGEGITLRQDENGTMTVLISGNDITEITSNQIHINGQDATVDDDVINVDATITNNTGVVAGAFGAGLLVDVGDGSGIAKNDVRINVSDNNLDGTETADFFDFDITLQLNETSGASLRVTQASNAALTAANNGMSVSSFANPPNTITYNAGTPPTPPLPLFFAPSDDDAVTPPVAEAPVDHGNVTPPIIIRDDAPPAVEPPVIVDDGVLSQAELNSLVAAAIARWEASGLTAEQVSLLHNVTFTIVDLPGWYLGSAGDGVVTLDSNAAGNAWFVDPTPLDDSEFAVGVPPSGGLGPAKAGTPAAGRVDALTTIMHELGHQLGLDDSYASADSANLMYGWIGQSERRLPTAGQAAGADPHDHEHDVPDFLFGVMNLGALAPGRSLTIVYDATVNAMTNGVPPMVASQVRIQANGGIDVLSDDLAAGGAADPTTTDVDGITLGNLVWDDVDGNGTLNGAEAGINGVTVKLYVDDGDGVLDAGDGAAIDSTITAGGGLYSFSVLPGEYLVEIAAANFQAGGALEGRFSSLGASIDPDNNVNNDDNGVNDAAPATNGISSQAITLDYNTEVTDDGTGQLDINNTLDFGFYTNLPPVLAVPGSITYTENDPATAIAAGLTVTDPDSGTLASATVTITNFVAGQDVLSFVNDGATMGNIAVGSNAAGVLTLTSAGATATTAQWQAALRAVAYANTSDSPNTTARSVDFVASDGTDPSTALTSTINITAVNDAPTFTSSPLTDATEDVAYSYSITTADVDAGATLTITASTLPAWLTLTDNGDGTATLSGTPTNSEVGANSLVLELSDGIAPAVQQSFTITVANVNDAPTFTSAAVIAATEDAAYTYNVTAQDVDAGATLTITASTLPAWLTLTDNGDGTATLSGTPANGDVGANSVVLEVTDGIAPAVLQSFTITVANTNDAPTFTSSPLTAATEDVAYSYTATTQDVDAGSTLTITAPTLPAWLTFTDNGDGTASLTGTPTNAEVGDHSVVLEVSDGIAPAVQQSFTITVANTNDAPTFTSAPVIAATEDAAYTYHVTAQDADAGATLTITASTLPAWLTLTDNGDGTATLSGTPTNAEVGDHNVVLEVSDGIAPPVQQSFTITVANVNDAPTFTSPPVTDATEDAAYSYNITTQDVDAGSTVTITAPTLPAWLTFTDNGDGTATLTGTPTNAEVGDHSVVLEVSDGIAPAVQQSFTITVANTNDAPSLDTSLSPTLTTIEEDPDDAAGTAVSSLLAGAFSDPDAGSLQGIAVTSAANFAGEWQYSLSGGGSGSWNAMGNPSPSAALLLPASAFVRFVPDANFNGEVKLWYHAWDQTEGSAARTLDVFASNSVSAAWDSAALTVSPANDSPVLDTSLNPTLQPTAEDALVPASTRVSDLIAGAITDVDDNPLQGIAVTSASTFDGTWEYSLDGGATYVSMGTPTPTAALLLPPSARVRFLPQADFNGTVKLWYHAWDQTQGTAGGTLSVKGEHETASTGAQWESADLVVLPVNDAPVLTLSGTVGYVHDTPPIQLAPNASVTDIDSADFDGGRLKVQITDGASSSNRLAIGAGFTVDENDNVLQGATIIGRRGENGFGTNDLVIWFNANATPFKVQQLVRAITFKTVGGAAGDRKVVFDLNDGDGGLSAEAVKTVSVS